MLIFLFRFMLAAGKDRALMSFDLSAAAGSRGNGHVTIPGHMFIIFLYVPINTPQLLMTWVGHVCAKISRLLPEHKMLEIIIIII